MKRQSLNRVWGFAVVGFVVLGLAVLNLSCEEAPSSNSRGLLEIPQPNLETHDPAIRGEISGRVRLIDASLKSLELDSGRLSELYGELAMLFHAHDLFESAQACYQNARTLDGDLFDWIYLLACAHRDAGQPELAVARFRESLQVRTTVSALVNLAELELALGHDEEARELIMQVLEQNGDCARARFLLGKIHARRNEYASAVSAYESALALQPAASSVYYPLAMAKRKLGDHEMAQQLLAKVGQTPVRLADPLMEAVARRRLGAHAKQNSALDMIRAGAVETGLKLLAEAARQEGDDPSIWATLGRELARDGQLTSAHWALSQALKLDPDNHEAHVTVGRVFALEENWKQALEHTRNAVRIAPGSRRACHGLAMVLEKTGEFDEALEYFRKVVQLDPGRSAMRRQELALLMKSKRWVEASRRFEEGMAVCPRDPFFLRGRAELLATCPVDGVRDGLLAVQLATRAMAEFPGSESTRVLAMACAETGDFERAVELATEAIEQAPASLRPDLETQRKQYQSRRPVRLER